MEYSNSTYGRRSSSKKMKVPQVKVLVTLREGNCNKNGTQMELYLGSIASARVPGTALRRKANSN